MVIKGQSVAGAKRLAVHLQRTDTNERMEVKELVGIAAQDLAGALREMEAIAAANPNCRKPFYHASINTRADERLTDAQRAYAIDRLAAGLQLSDQPRVVVIHEKEGREHCHIVFSRIDIATLRTISDSHNYRKHEIVARQLEREFGHARVQGAHVERENRARPERTPSHFEMQQAGRTGISPKEAREQLTALWRQTDSAASFQGALEQAGWTLARGDRRDVVAIDRGGGIHSLARRIDGASAKDIRARLADFDLSKLPGVTEARAAQWARHGRPARETHGRAAAPKPQAASRDQPPAPIRIIGGVVRPAAPARGLERSAGGVLRTAGKLADGIASAFEGLLGGASPRPARSDDRRPLDAGRVPPQAETDQARQLAEADKSQRRQRFLREFSREVPEERQQDAELERDRKGRERER